MGDHAYVTRILNNNSDELLGLTEADLDELDSWGVQCIVCGRATDVLLEAEPVCEHCLMRSYRDYVRDR